MHKRKAPSIGALALVAILGGSVYAGPPPADTVEDAGLAAHRKRAQHGPLTGHLEGSGLNMKLIGRLRVHNAEPGRVSDVSNLGNYAYLGDFGAASDPECRQTGVYVIDISNASKPREVGFIPAAPNTFVGENVQALHLETAFFRGDVLMMGHEGCGAPPPAPEAGGISLWDVTDPLHPVALALNVGDTDDTGRAHFSHSARAWQQGSRAFAALVDNEELADVDILDITNPRAPVKIAEVGLLDWPDAQTNLAHGSTAFHHDLTVRNIGGNWLLLVSYWDAGYIILNVNDPAKPVFVGDSDFPDPDPLTGFSPEGNGHYAEFDATGNFILAADEDFSPFRLHIFEITTGPNAGPYDAGEFGWTVPISQKFPDGRPNGPTIHGGSGCVEDLNGNGISDRNEVPPASTLPANPGEEKIVVFTRGVCFFSIKVESGQLAGYDVVIISNSHAGAGGGLTPHGHFCGGQGHDFVITVSAVCIGHQAGHLLFNDPPEFDGPNFADMPPIGTLGERVVAESEFDGWGYLRLIDANTLQEIDGYAVPEALNPAFAFGFGDLTVHEVATDPEINLVYSSYYHAGARVFRFDRGGLTEIGHFIHEKGNNFWGVQFAFESKQALKARLKEARKEFKAAQKAKEEAFGADQERREELCKQLPGWQRRQCLNQLEPDERAFKRQQKQEEAAFNASQREDMELADRPLILMSDRDDGLWIFKYTGPEPAARRGRGGDRDGDRGDSRGGDGD